jgi:hypothetical protein
VEHSHREPRAAAEVGPPSQAGASIRSRPRTTGAFQFKTRPIPSNPERAVVVSEPERQHFLPRQPVKPVSVQAAKSVFEGKIAQNRSALQIQPSRAAGAVKGTPIKKASQVKQTSLPPDDEPTTSPPAPKRRDPDPTMPIPRRPPQTTASSGPSQRTNPFSRSKVKTSGPNVSVTKATERQDAPVLEDTLAASGPGGDDSDLAPGTSTIAPSVTANMSRQSRLRQASEETVRSSTTHNPKSAAKLEVVKLPVDQGSTQNGSRSGSGGVVRSVVGEDEGSPVRNQLGQRQTQNAFLAGTAAQRDSSQSTENYISLAGFSCDGTSPKNEPPYSPTPERTPTLQGGSAETERDNIEVLHDVDWRAAYGRRKTQDFGFPGAGIKSRATARCYRAPEDSGSWVKHTCGHFSHIRRATGCEYVSQQRCRRCSKIAPLIDSHMPKRRRTRKQASTESSRSSSSVLSGPAIKCEHRSRCRVCRSDTIPVDKCGKSLCTDLGLMIDMILKEHSNSLKGIIVNIERTQPGIANFRRLSKRIVRHCEAGGACPVSCGSCEFPYPCCPPKVAEKLNVRSPGQLNPSVNDSRSSLREAVQTVPDLVDFINSAADNFGLDLDKRPTARDDRLFEDAPVAGSQTGSVASCDIEEKSTDGEQPNEDPWLQQTRRHFTELAEARTKMLDELDAIAGPHLEQLEDHLTSGRIADSPRRRLSRLSAQLSSKSTRTKSFGQLSRGPTRHSTQPVVGLPPEMILSWSELAETEMPAAIASVSSFLDSLPGSVYQLSNEKSETHEPFDDRHPSEPVYGERRLSRPTYEELFEPKPVYRKQSSHKPKCDSEPEVEYEPLFEPGYDQDDHAPSLPQHSHTDPIFGLYDRIVELGRHLRDDTMRVTSPRHSLVQAENVPEVEKEQSFSSDL